MTLNFLSCSPTPRLLTLQDYRDVPPCLVLYDSVDWTKALCMLGNHCPNWAISLACLYLFWEITFYWKAYLFVYTLAQGLFQPTVQSWMLLTKDLMESGRWHLSLRTSLNLQNPNTRWIGHPACSPCAWNVEAQYCWSKLSSQTSYIDELWV